MSMRRVLNALAVALTGYMAARGLWWNGPVLAPVLVLTATGCYLATTALCIFIPSRQHRKLPLWVAVLAVLIALTVPSAVAIGVGESARNALYATWYLGGIGALMTIIMARRRPIAAWMGTVAVAIASGYWLGPAPALALGLVGSVMWVAVAQLLVWSLDRAARDTDAFAVMQQSAAAWEAAQLSRRRQRRLSVRRALRVAGPVLTETISSGGELSLQQRLQARVAEGALRDEIRGEQLLDDRVRAELARARLRGASVSVIDDGGLADLDQTAKAQVRAELAQTLRGARSERLYIRTSTHAEVAVTVVGRSAAGSGLSEHDHVELWHEIGRPDSHAEVGGSVPN